MHMRPAGPEDELFRYETFAASKHKEIAAWGFGENEAKQFIRMQFYARESSYSATYPNASNMILCSGEERTGVLRIHYGEEATTIVDIAMLPDVQGKGIGTQVMLYLQGEADTTGQPLRLHVDNNNTGALRLYERLGFKADQVGDIYTAMTWMPSENNL
ncbi:MAG: GNAT family N-acetyltransferase [Candidatus Pristimantibacillus sp.]